jgi:capsular polysaccharide biosynthesis protein
MKSRALRARWALSSAFVPDRSPRLSKVYESLNDDDPRPAGTVFKYAAQSVIEPEHGFVIGSGGDFLDASLVTRRMGISEAWRHGMPDPTTYKHTMAKGGENIDHYPVVVSMRHLWEQNYFHFVRDILTKIPLLEAAGIDKNVPLVLGHYANQSAFVKELIHRGSLAERTWIVPGSNYVSADEVYFCQIQQQVIPILSELRHLIGAPPPRMDSSDKVYLTRIGKRGVENQIEVDILLEKYGFEVADTASMSVDQQIDLFRRVRYLIIVHGAAMINIIFRHDAPLSVLELNGTWKSDDLRMLCASFGYPFKKLEGQSMPGDPELASFVIDVREMEGEIRKMLSDEY